MQTVRVWKHEREQWKQFVRSQIGSAEFVHYGDLRNHSIAKWVLRKREGGRSISVSPDFLLIFPYTTTYRTAVIACEFTDSILSEAELRDRAKEYGDTFVNGLALIQRFCGGQDQFFEFSFYGLDWLRAEIQQDESSEPHVSFIEWSQQLHHYIYRWMEWSHEDGRNGYGRDV